MGKIIQFLKRTRIISRILFFVWAGYVLLFLLVALTDAFSFVDFVCAFIGFSAFFLIPAVLIEYKKNPIIAEKNQNKQKPSLIHSIWGIILLEMSPLMVMGGILGISYSDPNEWVPLLIPLILGIGLFFLGILLISGYITKVKVEREQRLLSKPNKATPHDNEAIPIAGSFRTGEVDYDEVDDVVNFGDVSAVDGMDGHEFEYFCADLLRNNGFSEVSVTRGSGDQGVDILATKGGIKYAVQCKNYASPLNNTPVQEVAAGKLFYNCHVGVVLTNSTFTLGAISLANATGVLLWDRSVLSELMKVRKEATPIMKETTSALTPPQENTQVGSRYSNSTLAGVTNSNARSVCESEMPPQVKNVRIDNINIEIDVQSLKRYNIVLDNFGLEMDEDDENVIELLFDVVSKGGRKLPCTVDIVCNLYAGNRKIMTEREAVYNESFLGRDSCCVYFDKKRICKTATRIELFCQEW